MKIKNKLFLIDGMALVYRAHFAFSKNPIVNSKGLNTSAVYGFLNTLLELLNKETPTHIAIAFDTKTPTFRSWWTSKFSSCMILFKWLKIVKNLDLKE